MKHFIQYGTSTITYDLSFAKRKTLSITVHPDLHVSVKAPKGVDPDHVQQRVQRRAAWILKRQREFELYLPKLPSRQYVSGETHLYLGRQYRLKIVEGTPENVKLTRGYLTIQVRDKKATKRVKKLLTEWYRGHARRVFLERLDACYARVQRLNIPFPEMAIRNMKSRWGSCSKAQQKILLNLKLIQTPKECIDYVIIHELCHLKIPHHGKAYYQLLDRSHPNWREVREKLNQMGIADM